MKHGLPVMTLRVERIQLFGLVACSQRFMPHSILPCPVPQLSRLQLIHAEAPAQIMLFGGCSTDHCAKGTDASKSSWRINVGFENTTWEVETMPVGRVMPWSTLLPDGTMFVMGGAQNGEASIRSLPAGSTAAQLHSSQCEMRRHAVVCGM